MKYKKGKKMLKERIKELLLRIIILPDPESEKCTLSTRNLWNR